MIIQSDSLEFMKKQSDYSLDIVFADPPYGMGSDVVIRPDGMVDYEKAVDFMSKWKMPTGDYWNAWFKESYRSLKHGGYCILFGMDRVTLLFKYYAHLAGFKEHQSMYWYFLSNFPKSSSLSKNIDKHFGEEREVVGIKEFHGHNAGSGAGSFSKNEYEGISGQKTIEEITSSSHPLAKKYDGYRYSISPLKQTNETIMIFSKPTKTGSVLHDTLLYEKGNKECCCAALNIDGCRVEFGNEKDNRVGTDIKRGYKNGVNSTSLYGDGVTAQGVQMFKDGGRYPAQSFIECICDEVIVEPTETKEPTEVSGGIWQKSIDGKGKPAGRTYSGGSQTHTNPNCPCAKLDMQSGDKTSRQATGVVRKERNPDTVFDNKNNGLKNGSTELEGYSDTGGCSKILHHCKFEDGEYDLYLYCPKVSKSERNAGCEEVKNTQREPMGNNQGTRVCVDCGLTDNGTNNHNSCSGKYEYRLCADMKNNHPTLKPISLIYKVLSLFKTPNPQKICYPFAGVQSEVIGGYKAGFTDFIGCELSDEYISIGNARFEYWKDKSMGSKITQNKSKEVVMPSKEQSELF